MPRPPERFRPRPVPQVEIEFPVALRLDQSVQAEIAELAESMQSRVCEGDPAVVDAGCARLRALAKPVSSNHLGSGVFLHSSNPRALVDFLRFPNASEMSQDTAQAIVLLAECRAACTDAHVIARESETVRSLLQYTETRGGRARITRRANEIVHDDTRVDIDAYLKASLRMSQAFDTERATTVKHFDDVVSRFCTVARQMLVTGADRQVIFHEARAILNALVPDVTVLNDHNKRLAAQFTYPQYISDAVAAELIALRQLASFT